MKKNNRGFSLIEILIILVVLGVVAAIAVSIYQPILRKSEKAEALLNMEAIRRQLLVKHEEAGTYPAAVDTAAVNQLLMLDVKEHLFSYKIVDATDSTFKIVASRLGPLLEGLPPLVVAMGPAGEIVDAAPAGSAGGGSSGGLPGFGVGGGGAGGGGSGSGGSGTGLGGGSGIIGGGIGGDAGFTEAPTADAPPFVEPAGFIDRGDDLWTNWPDLVPPAANITGDHAAVLQAAFALLVGSVADPIADDLARKGIEVTFGPAASFAQGSGNENAIAYFYFGGALTVNDVPDTPHPTPYIYFNPAYVGEAPGLLADVLVHEGTHFEEFLDGTARDYINHIVTIVDVEFTAFWNEAVLWADIRAGFIPFDTPLELEEENVYQMAGRGEAYLRSAITQAYGN